MIFCSCPWHHWGLAKIQNPDIPSRKPPKSAFPNKHPIQVILTQVPPRTHVKGVAIEEVEVASCSQILEVSGIHGNPLRGSGRSGRFLGEDAEAGRGAEVEEVERGGHRRAGLQRREEGVDQQDSVLVCFPETRDRMEDIGLAGAVSLVAHDRQALFSQ